MAGKKSLLSKDGRFSAKSTAKRKAGAEYMRTVANASEKANQTMSFKDKPDFMAQVKKEAAKKYGLRVSFIDSGDK